MGCPTVRARPVRHLRAQGSSSTRRAGAAKQYHAKVRRAIGTAYHAAVETLYNEYHEDYIKDGHENLGALAMSVIDDAYMEARSTPMTGFTSTRARTTARTRPRPGTCWSATSRAGTTCPQTSGN